MSSSIIPMKNLNVEDFRRLGVRPNEIRLTVIRRAVSQTTRNLAKQQLLTPSTEQARQLSRVATSAYRLMDPRKRADPQQRAYVGRILPTTLFSAGQTHFFSRVGEPLEPSTNGDAISDKSTDANDSMEINDWMPGIDMPAIEPTVSRSADDVWLKSLGDDDLLITTPRSRRLKRIRRKWLPGWAWFTIGGLIIATSVGVPTLASRGVTERSPARTDRSSSVAYRSTENEMASLKPTSRTLAPTDQPKVESQIEPPAIPNRVTNEQTHLPDPFAAATTTAPPSDSDELTSIDSRSLRSVSPIASTPVDTAYDAPVGVMVASPPAEFSDTESSPQLLASNWITALRSMDGITDLSPLSRHRLFREGSAIGELLLTSELFDTCEQVVAQLSLLAELDKSQSQIAEVAQIKESILQMRRLQKSIDRESTSSSTTNAQRERAGALGRYECLMLRRWDHDSLSRLNHSNDRRLAALARQELEMPPDASADQWQTLAEQWLSQSGRTDGRASESMQLHAIDWIRRALSISDGLQRLELARMLDEQLDTLPPHLRVISATMLTSTRSKTPGTN